MFLSGIFACPPEMEVVVLVLCSYAVSMKPSWRQELSVPLVAALEVHGELCI